jgi:hypothetical protein
MLISASKSGKPKRKKAENPNRKNKKDACGSFFVERGGSKPKSRKS